jgi:hypothetical protein
LATESYVIINVETGVVTGSTALEAMDKVRAPHSMKVIHTL